MCLCSQIHTLYVHMGKDRQEGIPSSYEASH